MINFACRCDTGSRIHSLPHGHAHGSRLHRSCPGDGLRMDPPGSELATSACSFSEARDFPTTARRLRPPHGLLSPTEVAEFPCPQRRLIDREELIQLGRLDGRSGEHAMCLPPMMDLMLKQMHQQTIATFGLYPRVAIEFHHFVEAVRGQTLADIDETLVNRA